MGTFWLVHPKEQVKSYKLTVSVGSAAEVNLNEPSSLNESLTNSKLNVTAQ